MNTSPMLAGSTDRVPADDGRWVAEPKVDGWRTIMVNSLDGITVYGGRNGNVYTGRAPAIERALHAQLPPGCVIDGEFAASNGWGGVQSAMTTSGAAVGDHLTFIVFDILAVNDEIDVRGLPLHMRREVLEQIEWPEGCILIPQGAPSQEAHDAFLAAGLEGSMFKLRDSRYVNGRSASWVKLKADTTDEARITGFKPGKVGTEFEGKVGAFEVAMLASGAPTTVKCGAAKTHADAHAHPENWLGKVIEVKHYGLGKTGKPRHPSFVRVRPDRS